MAAAKRTKLTDAAVARLRPREREYTVWDSRVTGLGVRVRPSGGRSWVLLLDARRAYEARVARPGLRKERGRSPPGRSRTASRPAAGEGWRDCGSGPAVPGLRRRPVETRPL